MIPHSICLIVTGSSLIASTHDASHGAGQIRPVNSGKLFVSCRRSIAVRQSPRRTRSFHSGIRLPSGQPWWQNGTPQSMQRRPCSRSSSCGQGEEDLVVVARARARVALGRRDPLDLEEPARIGHQAASARPRARVEPSGRVSQRREPPGSVAVVRHDLHERVEVRRRSAAGEPVRSRCSAAARGRSARRRRRAFERRRASGCSAPRSRRRGRARRRSRRSCPPRSCARSGRARRTCPPVMYSQPWSPHALDDRVGAGVAHREALARQAAEERAARRRAVQRRVARDDVLVGADRAAGSTAITPPDRPLPA